LCKAVRFIFLFCEILQIFHFIWNWRNGG
jgi:hypothetical protein